MIDAPVTHIVDENVDVTIVHVQHPVKIECCMAREQYGTIHLVSNCVEQKLIWRRHWFFDQEGDKKIKWTRQVIGMHDVYVIQKHELCSYVDKDQEIWYFWKHMAHAMSTLNTNGWCGLVIEDMNDHVDNKYISHKISLVNADGMVIYDGVFPSHVVKVI